MKTPKIKTSIRLTQETLDEIYKMIDLINPKGSRNTTIEYLIDLGIREVLLRNMGDQLENYFHQKTLDNTKNQ